MKDRKRNTGVLGGTHMEYHSAAPLSVGERLVEREETDIGGFSGARGSG